MIQLDEKIPPPPAYSGTDGTLYPPAQPQSPPVPPGPYAAPAPPPPPQSPLGYPPVSPPAAGPGAGPGPGAPQPPQTDAQLAAQYQQQLFARCARGDHDVSKKYGPCGIITAVLLFPIGLICLFMDVDKKCARCGVDIP